MKIPLLLSLLFLAVTAHARDEWFRHFHLEPAVTRADLVLVVRVAEVSETKIIHGGKGESTLVQFRFTPARTLKGLFTRDSLSLTSQDLALHAGTDLPAVGQLRLLFLGRSGPGYAASHGGYNPSQSLPLLKDLNDPLLDAAQALLAANQETDRAKKTTLLVSALNRAEGPAAVPLLNALHARAFVAAQMPGALVAVARHLGHDSNAVRETAAQTLNQLFRATYLEPGENREPIFAALTAVAARTNSTLAPRIAAIEALASVGPAARGSAPLQRWIADAPERPTFAEHAARLQLLGRFHSGTAPGPALTTALATLNRTHAQLPLDAPDGTQRAALQALTLLDLTGAVRQIDLRLREKISAGLSGQLEIGLLDELPAAQAVPALLAAATLPLNTYERRTWAESARRFCERQPDTRLVPALAKLLAPRDAALRYHAAEALLRIDTPEAARTLQPHLREELDLHRKLRFAELLGRHGLRDGYPYALEHLSEGHLLEPAIAALAAIREPKTVAELKKILESSNDFLWNRAALRALGRLGEKSITPRCLDLAGDAKSTLAPSALIVLGDLAEPKALPLVRTGLASRNDEMVVAACRAAVALNDDAIRDQLAGLLSDPAAAAGARLAAFETLEKLRDPRLARTLPGVVREARLEEESLLARAEKHLREHKIPLGLN